MQRVRLEAHKYRCGRARWCVQIHNELFTGQWQASSYGIVALLRVGRFPCRAPHCRLGRSVA